MRRSREALIAFSCVQSSACEESTIKCPTFPVVEVSETEQTAGGQKHSLEAMIEPFEAMIEPFQPYDIFRLKDDGTSVWLEPAPTLDDAQKRVNQFGASEPGEYLILNQENAEKITMRVSRDGPTTVKCSPTTLSGIPFTPYGKTRIF